jgi:Lon protease-like protein
MCSLRRVFALASELGSDVSGIELELADDRLAASYQLAALCPLNALDSQRLLEANGASTRLDLARAMLDDRAELLRIELSAP